MKIEKLEIRNFGKMQNRTLEFSDGIQLISGENESGKSTVHTFIRSMLFGMTRGRGRAAKNDVYSRYEPWENPAYYAGEMVFESGGKRFRLTRNFGRQNANAKLVCLTDGEVLSVGDGDLSMLLGGVSEIVYDNTASIGQLKGRTEEGLADELLPGEIPVVVDLITQGGAADAQHLGCIAQCDAFALHAGEEQHGICHKKCLLLVSNSGCDAQSLVVL